VVSHVKHENTNGVGQDGSEKTKESTEKSAHNGSNESRRCGNVC